MSENKLMTNENNNNFRLNEQNIPMLALGVLTLIKKV